MAAAYLDAEAIVALLLSHGADPNEDLPAHLCTPLMYSAESDDEDLAVMRLLLEHGARTETRLEYSEQEGDYDNPEEHVASVLWQHATDVHVLRVLVAYGADVDARDCDGTSALMRAAAHGKRDAVAVLVEAGADPTVRNEEGAGALSIAKKDGVQLLLRGKK